MQAHTSSAPRSGATPHADGTAWALLAGALAVHLLLMPAAGYERDIDSFGTWMRTALEHGVSRVSEQVQCDYPPGYLYLLHFVGRLWTTASGLPIPPAGSVEIRFLVKLLPTVADLATAWVLFHLAAAATSRRNALLVLAAYAYNPAMLFNAAVWGQSDSVMSLLVLFSAWAVWRGRTALGFGLLAAALLVKVQAVAVLPPLVLVAVARQRLAGLFAAARGGAVVTLVGLLPFYWAGRVPSVIETFLTASGRYPFVSMNAHNVWWLAGGGPAARLVSDATRLGNALLTYHTIGMLMLATATGLILWRLWRDLTRTAEHDARALCEACALQLLAFYLFPTEMHERYIVPALVFVAALCIWRPAAWWLNGAATLGVLVSLASTLRAAYPNNLGAFAALLPPSRPETWAVSVLFTALFATLLLWTPDRRFRKLAVVTVLLVAAGIAAVAVAPWRGAQPLGDWPPVAETQGWGVRRQDRTVDQNRLSVNGFIFRRGIGTHAHSQLTYHINGAFRTLDTLFGIDDEANRGQKMQFRILVDGQVRFDSGIVSGVDRPGHAVVPVVGAELLTLEVLDGGDGIHSDHADWLEPVLYR